jgi:putative LysE/RhtB family amino acid efflux pump
LRIAGGCYLLFLGGSALLAKPRAKSESEPDAETLLRDFLSTFGLTLTNPITILAFLGIFAALGLNGEGATLGRAAIMVLGVWIGSLMWWLALSFGLRLVFHSFETRDLVWINRGSGTVLLLSGAVLLAAPLIKHML